MTIQQAYKIFDVKFNITTIDLKKRYRKLMHKVHPDVVLDKQNIYQYSAYEINEAYTILSEQADGKNIRYNYRGQNSDYHQCKEESQEYRWTAPENEYAYCQRNVYHYAIIPDDILLAFMSGVRCISLR